MKLSCCLWALDEGSGLIRFWRRFRKIRVPESKTLPKLAHLGFRSVDICPTMQKTANAQSTLNDLGMDVCCISISHDAPPGSSFDSVDKDLVEAMERHTRQGIDHASNIGAEFTYVVPPPPRNQETLSNLAKHYACLAEHGKKQGVKVAIEHFPGTALPTVKETLAFIKKVDHPNLYLLFDLGHAQMSKEDPAKVLPLAGDRLAYVHLDDNDGEGDLHLALTDGIQTQESLSNFFSVLKNIEYTGPMSLEMRWTLPDPLDAIRRSKKLVERTLPD